MGRTKPPTSTELSAEVPLSSDLNVSLNAMTQRHMEIMQQFGDGQLYGRGHIVHGARFYMAQSIGAMLEAGKRLIILKENEPHEDFVGVVEEQLGLYVRTAQRMMKTSLKYLSPELEPKATALSLLGKVKLFELVVKDDNDLAELADGGTVAGLTFDDADHMSARGLCQALREARETNTTQQRILANKNKEIDSLSIRLEKKFRVQPPEPDRKAKKLRTEMTALVVEAESAIAVRLSDAFETLCAYYAGDMVDTSRGFMAGLVCQLENVTRSLHSTFDLSDRPTGNATPSWLTEPTPQINGLEA